MAIASAPAPAVTTETQPTAPVADAQRTTEDIFKWSQWVHVGDGAEECEKRFGGCADENHFHAWCRLPNPFQVRDIIEKAKAAQARKLRELRDPQSDSAVILEDELDQIRAAGDAAKPIIVDELLNTEYAEMNQRAIREVDALKDESWEPTERDTEEQRPLVWGHIDQDREELQRLEAAPEDQRDEAAISELKSRVEAYFEAIRVREREIEDQRRKELEARDLEDLLTVVKRDRMEMAGTEMYLHTFNTWQWFVCTFKPRLKGTPNERAWKDVNQMKYEAPGEVIATLREVFDGLEQRMRSRRAGKGS